MNSKRKIICLLVLCSVVLLGTSAEAKTVEYPLQVVDDLGNEVVIKEEPTRIISLAPNHTETLFALGLDEKLLAVTKFSNYPKEAREKTKVGTIKEPNIEKIVQLNPDLVLAAEITPKPKIKKLTELGINVVGLAAENVTGVIKDISLIGQITNQLQQTNKLTTEMNNRVKRVKKKIEDNVRDDQKPKVFYEVWKKPLYTAGPNTFIDNLISLAGGINIAHDAQGSWPQYSFEVLLAKNPDVYLSSKHSWKEEVTKDSIQKRERFKSIKAIKKGRVYILEPDLVNRAGPRIVLALEKIAKALHPELF